MNFYKTEIIPQCFTTREIHGLKKFKKGNFLSNCDIELYKSQARLNARDQKTRDRLDLNFAKLLIINLHSQLRASVCR